FVLFFFFFSSRRRHTRSKRDWSSDVCSSDLHNCFTQHTLLCKRFCTFCDALHTRLFLGSDHHVTGPFRDCSLLADQTRYRFLVYSSIRLPKITHRSFPQARSIRRRRWGAIHVPVARPQPERRIPVVTDRSPRHHPRSRQEQFRRSLSPRARTKSQSKPLRPHIRIRRPLVQLQQ